MIELVVAISRMLDMWRDYLVTQCHLRHLHLHSVLLLLLVVLDILPIFFEAALLQSFLFIVHLLLSPVCILQGVTDSPKQSYQGTSDQMAFDLKT